jgi:uncharacterized protein (TIGR02271 family)
MNDKAKEGTMASKPARKSDKVEDPHNQNIKPAVIPVIHEEATISKRVVETGKVRIAKNVREYEEIVDIPHFQEEVNVDRVPVNQFVDEAPSIRNEGDATIIPVLEERYVLEKRLFLVEELHIRKDRIEKHNPQTVKVLKEEVTIERISPAESRGQQSKAASQRPRRTEQ